tara:strand:+ start:91 stop:432 length:342 start_codon:yes stop_codon:yes gene_type:complete
MDYNETDALLEQKLDRKLEEEIQKEGEQNASSSDVNTLNKTLSKLLQDGNVINKPSFYQLTGSMTLPQRIYDVKKSLDHNFRIVSKRGKYNLSHYWLERIKTKTLDDIIWEKV